MKKTLLKNSAFLIPYILFLIISCIFLSIHTKGNAHLIINQYRSDFCDYLFSALTYLGDGITVVIIVIALCLYKYRDAFLIALSNSIASLITQTLKHTLFADQVRPKKYFEGIANLKLIPWVENYSYNTFPSGHATVAFATFFCFALLTENKYMKFAMFCIAFLIAFSRVYMSQHFLNDIVAGSLIGTATTLIVYQYIFQSEKIRHTIWLEKSVLKSK